MVDEGDVADEIIVEVVVGVSEVKIESDVALTDEDVGRDDICVEVEVRKVVTVDMEEESSMVVVVIKGVLDNEELVVEVTLTMFVDGKIVPVVETEASNALVGTDELVDVTGTIKVVKVICDVEVVSKEADWVKVFDVTGAPNVLEVTEVVIGSEGMLRTLEVVRVEVIVAIDEDVDNEMGDEVIAMDEVFDVVVTGVSVVVEVIKEVVDIIEVTEAEFVIAVIDPTVVTDGVARVTEEVGGADEVVNGAIESVTDVVEAI